eukprot:CFRG0018T1
MAPVAHTDLEKRLIIQFQRSAQRARQYEDKTLHARALSHIPTLSLYEKAHAELHAGTHIHDELIKQLLRWFKRDFFKWVDKAPCERCTEFNLSAGIPVPETELIGGGNPTPEELMHDAERVEIYLCTQCNEQIRFPRYNDPGKLLETRRGRCGEWANCFTLIARALGFKARYILDMTDHVWTEVYSEYLQRWVHTDCCEAKFDTPLVYEKGWGKKLTYVFAFSAEEVVDVARRYTENYPEVQSRQTMATSEWIEQLVRSYDIRQREHCPYYIDMGVFYERRKKEMDLLREGSSARGDGGDEEGRTSGAVAWRLLRRETKISGDSFIPIYTNPKLVKWVQKGHTDTLIPSHACVIQPSGQIVLTPNACNQVGAVYLSTHIPSTHSFLCEFVFSMDKGGADGIAFVVHPNGSNAVGKGGCGLGYSGIENCLAVEFDSYDSMAECDDPSSNHVSVHVGLGGPVTSHHGCSLESTSRVPRLNNGQPRFVRILYLKETLTLKIALKTSASEEYFDILTTQIDVGGIIDKPIMFMGFTASTGGLAQTHSVWDIDIMSWPLL